MQLELVLWYTSYDMTVPEAARNSRGIEVKLLATPFAAATIEIVPAVLAEDSEPVEITMLLE